MNANTKKVYATPALASHGSVIGKTEAQLQLTPVEGDGTKSRTL